MILSNRRSHSARNASHEALRLAISASLFGSTGTRWTWIPVEATVGTREIFEVWLRVDFFDTCVGEARVMDRSSGCRRGAAL
jgi:hypothetical protein